MMYWIALMNCSQQKVRIMPIELVDNPTCDTCGEPATHVDVGYKGLMLDADKGWSCEEHAVDIDLKPIDEAFAGKHD